MLTSRTRITLLPLPGCHGVEGQIYRNIDSNPSHLQGDNLFCTVLLPCHAPAPSVPSFSNICPGTKFAGHVTVSGTPCYRQMTPNFRVARHPPTGGATRQGCFQLPRPDLGSPCRAFTCAQKPLIRRRPLTCPRDLERGLIKVVMLVSGCGLSCGNNDAGTRTLASTVIAVPHSRIKVHGVS